MKKGRFIVTILLFLHFAFFGNLTGDLENSEEFSKVEKLREKGVHEEDVRYGYTLKDIAEYLGMHYANN